MYIAFPLKRLFRGSPRQPKIIKDNEITQSKEVNENEISAVPKSEIKTAQNQLLEQSFN